MFTLINLFLLIFVCSGSNSGSTSNSGSSSGSSSGDICDGDSNTISLSQNDFEDGTKRITESGYYIFTSDVIFSPKEDLDSPNDECAWFPCNDDNYPGSSDNDIEGPYTLGFFSALTIEANDVTIDLCGHELRMSDEFYLQQRFYSNIEVSSSPFIPGQGPADFHLDEDITHANNTVIKNGVLGLSSHHGIHGVGPVGVVIQDMTIKNFEVAGIHFNGFINLEIMDVEIGPISTNVHPSAFYSAARFLLKPLRKIVDRIPDSEISFDDRDETLTVQDVLDELEYQMDFFFNDKLNRLDESLLNEDDESYLSYLNGLDLFTTENGFIDCSATYGIVLHSFGVAVNNFGNGIGFSNNAILENIRIHDLHLETTEVIGFVDSNNNDKLTVGPNGDVIDLNKVVFDVRNEDYTNKISQLKYYGNALSDAQLTIAKFGDPSNFETGNTLSVSDSFLDWALEGSELSGTLLCNQDMMNHLTKGVFGIRIDETNNVVLNNIRIEYLNNWSKLGSLVCGSYNSGENGGHQNQFDPDTYGAVHTRGISIFDSSVSMSDIFINHINSKNGDSIGIDILDTDSQVTFGDNIEVNNINSGIGLKRIDLDNIDAPNGIPIVCDIAGNTLNDLMRLDENDISNVIMTGEIICDSISNEFSTTEDPQGKGGKSSSNSSINNNSSVAMYSALSAIIVLLILGTVFLAFRRYRNKVKADEKVISTVVGQSN